ncbi:MAG: hypothetical protein OHK0029_14350 [Armatimonadaceae bacterium]
MKPTLLGCVLVALGSGAGGVCRYLLGSWIAQRTEQANGFPWGIFAVNVAGCFLLGFLSTYLGTRENAWSGWKLLLGIGFLGGFTTFSTLLWDTWRLGPRIGMLNLLASGMAGYIAVTLAVAAARAAFLPRDP